MAKNETNNWPELAIALYDKLTGRGAKISYEFKNFELFVPAGVGAGTSHAHWKFDGQLNITTKDEPKG